jgi:hypothetical protein
MTVKIDTSSATQSNPWVETPLRESYALSEAAGWYGHTLPAFLSCPPSTVNSSHFM